MAYFLTRDECARLSDVRIDEGVAPRPLCYFQQSRERGNVRYCLKINARATGYLTDSCVQDMALIKGDLRVCKLLKDNDRIDRCIKGARMGIITTLFPPESTLPER